MDTALEPIAPHHEIVSVMGRKIKIIRAGWDNIVRKHPDLANKFNQLVETLIDAETVMISKADPLVYLYYRKVSGRKYLCAVCKHYDGKGFLITAYYTYRPHGARTVWKST
ncbi:hypothetical protein A3J43_03065 [Candidatus Uhrbacteria bacterium RIFCSPHIGHO2_12_FULL_54_23]|uniref:Phage-Barnase-EndoU-ColicinE5/D-RelE like nuclease 2 domain-containing protein n=2 Tax=Candidatus Uhriibacteriota TaxID=1752732 RepID=A0A1F7UGD0_9BACT|nr:MAG: hypothetical protein A3J43_03065 [Candidatus Uhrbacteria bacterium RIFCSPHIGHO2_12_FULL_54_23]OGL90129.1 MAG: hypothetical protein A3J36_02375 [Candidatus Uhrbacteria bacterium RIFCSPLOWO2_02_FULL_54_37]